MATVTIRNLSDEVVAALKERARRNSRSMEAEARALLTRFTEPEGDSGLEVHAAARVRQRWAVPAAEVTERISMSPPPEVDTAAWLADIRADGDLEDFRDPWERDAPS